MTLPSDVLPLKSWKLTLPAGAKGKPTELSGPALATYDGDWFRVSPDGGVAFRAPVNGVTTSGSGYPRSELRELNADGSLASWSSSTRAHSIVAVEAFTELPLMKPHCVGMQIHDDSDDICVFRLEGTKLYVTHGNDTHYALVDTAYVLGTKFEARFDVYADVVTASYNGKPVATIKGKFSKAFFKIGCYTQANCTNSTPCSSANCGAVTVYSVKVSHTAKPVPVTPPVPVPEPVPDPTPVPVPVPTPGPSAADVVLVIRHGEKSKDKADHTLNATGRERAQRLVGFFTKAPLKAGILTPQRIYASKGTSASMRPLQTVQPLAATLGLTIDSHWDFETVESTVGKALAAQHGVTLASAEHTAIPGMCKAFKLAKGSPKVPSGWPSSRFDLVWKFTRQPDGTWLFAQINQGLMPGDKDFVVSKTAGFLAAIKQTLGIGL